VAGRTALLKQASSIDILSGGWKVTEQARYCEKDRRQRQSPSFTPGIIPQT
jgi:hypothetical protein